MVSDFLTISSGDSSVFSSSASAAVTAPGLTNTRPKDPADLHLLSDPGERRGEMLYRPFGRHDEKISAIGMGGFHLGKNAVSDDEATRLIHAGIERGITFMDNCWDYNGGRSELRMGVALSQGGYRDKVFLMSKMDGRTKEEALKQIDPLVEARELLADWYDDLARRGVAYQPKPSGAHAFPSAADRDELDKRMKQADNDGGAE